MFYIVDSFPEEIIKEELESIGCSTKDIEEALLVLNSGANKGITYSNPEARESVIAIGRTSCPAQFAHSYDHEKLHLAMHIAKKEDIDPFSEDLAYLIGDIGFEMFRVAKLFLCEHCRMELV